MKIYLTIDSNSVSFCKIFINSSLRFKPDFMFYRTGSIRFELMKYFYLTNFKFAAIDRSANFLLIPQRLELRTHPYQKYALPIKLRNLTRVIRFERIMRNLKFLSLPLAYTLYYGKEET